MTENNVQNEPQAKKSKKGLIIGIIVALLAVGGAVAGALMLTGNKGEEETAYALLEDNDNPADYEQFLADYPNSAYAFEVQKRLKLLNQMLSDWSNIANSGNKADFLRFKEMYANANYVKLCDLKLDSLDWIAAQRENTAEAYERYLAEHPEGTYASEASVAQGSLRDSEVPAEMQALIQHACEEFFAGFAERDFDRVCQNIPTVMDRFLTKQKATKADVMQIINGMFNEHIESCTFTLNRDFEITRSTGPDPVYTARFSVDQNIQRDNEGKTFGSYKAVAVLDKNLLITSLTLEEVSRR